MTPKTLEQEFAELVARFYPDAPVEDSDQLRMLREMFFAGCLVAYTSGADFSGDLLKYADDLRVPGDGKAAR